MSHGRPLNGYLGSMGADVELLDT